MGTPLEWREQRGMSLREAAAALGIAPQSLMRYERGERAWPLAVAKKFADLTKGKLGLAAFLPQRKTRRAHRAT